MIPSGLKVTGVVLSDQVKSLDWKIRGAEFCDKLSYLQNQKRYSKNNG